MGPVFSKRHEIFSMDRWMHTPSHLHRRERLREFDLIREEISDERQMRDFRVIMRQSISFLDLPRELRDRIYAELFPHDIRLNKPACNVRWWIIGSDEKKYEENKKGGPDKEENQADEEEEQEESPPAQHRSVVWADLPRGTISFPNMSLLHAQKRKVEGTWLDMDSDDFNMYGDALVDLRSKYPILFVSKQIAEEALQYLYTASAFSFRDDVMNPSDILTILSSLPAVSLRNIRHLAFDLWAFYHLSVCEGQQFHEWGHLFDFVEQNMCVDTITADLPYDEELYREGLDDGGFEVRNIEEDSDAAVQRKLWRSQTRIYYWPALRALISCLMSEESHLKKLILIHPLEVGPEDIEKLRSIRMLRIPRDRKADCEVEKLCEGEVHKVCDKSQCGFNNRHAWEEGALSQGEDRTRHDFLINNSNNWDGSMTLVLTKRV